MDLPLRGSLALEGDLIQLQGSGHKSHIFVLHSGETLQTHRGVIKHDDIIGQPWGAHLQSHMGAPFYLFQPGLSDLINETKRTTQIMYPKEIGFILITMGIGPGRRVIECGTGSGGLTTALAYMVGETGHVYTYERKEEVQKLAITNLEKLGLAGRVDFKVGNAADGFAEQNADALFLDLPNPYEYMPQVKAALKGGGYLGMILPTFNQVSKTLEALKTHHFAFVQVCEILMRYYKTDWDRLRPTDRMLAHTGYLLFARSVNELDPEILGESEETEA